MTKIERIRKIVAECQRAKVEGKMVDLFTAQAIIAVHDHLSPENQTKFLDMPIGKMATVAFRLLKN